MIFNIFHSNFSLYDSLKKTVFKHLEWLKFQTFSKDSAPKPLQNLQNPYRTPEPPAVFRTVYIPLNYSAFFRAYCRE